LRIFAISDIHVDYPDNARWIANLSATDYTDDVIILAGDVSHHIREVETTVASLNRCFKKVLFVPGNHDVWTMKNTSLNSIEKFDQLLELATNIGASTTPFHHNQLSIIPLFSWYDYSFNPPSDELKKVWADYVACSWPNSMGNPEVTEFFLEKNEIHLDTHNKDIITFSHFLPRIDVMPSYIPKQHQMLYPVLGSAKLDKQIRKVGSKIHVYGHSHVNRNIEIEGINYVNNAFGYPGEERITAKKLQCIYET
jgi:predicted phosphodiesterase